MKKLIMIGAAVVAVGANADTVTLKDMTWTYTPSGQNAELTACSGNNTTAFDAADIPWTFTNNDTEYTVTSVNNTFKNWEKMTGALSIPDEVTAIGSFEKCHIASVSFGSGLTRIPKWCFKNADFLGSVVLPSTITEVSQDAFSWCDRLSAVWIKGPAASSGSYCTVHETAFDGAGVKVFLAGLQTKANDMSSTFNLVDKCKAFVPANGYWGDFSSGVMTLRYGAGQELDILIDEQAMTLTATVATENALTNVLASAADFKQYFGLDTVVSITNNIDASVEITEEMLNNATLNVPTWYMAFAVKTQAQLDRVLAATTGPIVADITGATEEITPPVGRRVAILAPGGATFNYHNRGLTISFY